MPGAYSGWLCVWHLVSFMVAVNGVQSNPHTFMVGHAHGHTERSLAALWRFAFCGVRQIAHEPSRLWTMPHSYIHRTRGSVLTLLPTVPVIKFILSSPSIPSPNLPVNPPSTATALHVASDIGRPEVVELLLNDPRIDDTIRDDKGRTALECSSNPEVGSLIEGERRAVHATACSRAATNTAQTRAQPSSRATWSSSPATCRAPCRRSRRAPACSTSSRGRAPRL